MRRRPDGPGIPAPRLPRGARVVLAVSGGADSIAMAALLREEAPRRGWRIFWAHANHGLRGAESDADERFVVELAGAWGVPCAAERVPVPAGGSLEAAAREARYAFLERAARAAGARWVLTAHTRDDQAETALMRLARGTGPRGLRGILPARPILPGSGVRLLRPFLDVPRERLRAFLSERGIPSRFDSTNADLRFARNRVRAFLAASGRGEDLAVRLARTASSASRLWRRVSAAVRARRGIWREEEGATSIGIAGLSEVTDAVAREILRAGIRRRSAAGPSRSDVERLLRLAREAPSGRSIDLACGRWRREYDRLVWLRAPSLPPSPVGLRGEGRRSWGPWRFSVARRGVPSGAFSFRLRPEALSAPLEIRAWRPGDRIRGKAGSRKLSDFWGDRRIPRSLREAWPLLCRGNMVVAVPGLAVHAGFAPVPGGAGWSVTVRGGTRAARRQVRRFRRAGRAGAAGRSARSVRGAVPIRMPLS